MRLITFRDLLETAISRRVIGFDIFGHFPRSKNARDNAYAAKHDNIAGRGISSKELSKVLSFKGFSNVELIEGNILETLPAYLKKIPT